VAALELEAWRPSPQHLPRAFRTPCKIPDRPPTDFRNFDKIQPWSLPWFGRRLVSGNLRSILTENPGQNQHRHNPFGLRRSRAAFYNRSQPASDPPTAAS